MLSVTAATPSRRWSTRVRRQPSRASSSAMAAPMPEPAPVIRPAWPAMGEVMYVLHRGFQRSHASPAVSSAIQRRALYEAGGGGRHESFDRRAARRHGGPALSNHPDLARGARSGQDNGPVLPRLRLGAVAGLRPRAAGPPPHGAARTTSALRAARG